MADTEKSFLTDHREYVMVERHVLQDNIILCDTKCGILLGFGALILLWCLDKILTLSENAGGPFLLTLAQAILYACATISLLVTISFTWRVIRPRIRQANDHIYWGSQFFLQSKEDFVTGIHTADQDVLANDMLIHLHILAGICRDKFKNFGRAVIAAELSAAFVFLAVSARIAANYFQAA